MNKEIVAVAVLFLAFASCGRESSTAGSSRSDMLVEEAVEILAPEVRDIAVAMADGASRMPALRLASLKLEEALEADTSHARAASLLARLKARIAFYSDDDSGAQKKTVVTACLADASRALETGRKDAGVWIDRAVVSLTLAFFEEAARSEELRQSAVDDLTFALKLDPGSTEGLYVRAFAYASGACWPYKPSPASWLEDMFLVPPSAEKAARNVDLLSAAERDLLDMKHLDPRDPRLQGYLDYIVQNLSDWRRRKAAVTVMTPGEVFDVWKDSVVLLESDKGSGTGFVAALAPNIEHGILILTNRHVVENASRRFVKVHLRDGRVLPGRVARLSKERDLAIVDTVKAKGFGRPAIETGADSVEIGNRGEEMVWFAYGETAPSIGDRIVVIGHPGAQAEGGGVVMLSWTLTEGTLSALRDEGNLLQHDAPTNPGNSGGPILDLHGRVVGVVQSLVRGADPRLPAGHILEGVGLGETADNARAFLLQTTQEMAEGMPRPVAPLGRVTRYKGWIDFQADFGKTYDLAFETESAQPVSIKLYAYEGVGTILLDSREGMAAPGKPLTLAWTCIETGWYLFALLGRDGTSIPYSAKVEVR